MYLPIGVVTKRLYMSGDASGTALEIPEAAA
jgi:hypothetical protein